MLRPMVSRPVCLGVKHPSGAYDQIFITCVTSYGLVRVGRPLWREDGSLFCMCCWPLPAQSFSGPSPLGLETIFYCLTFETSLFVDSYGSQGHGGGIRPRLHTGLPNSYKWNFPFIFFHWIFYMHLWFWGAHGNVVGWDTMLQAGRSRVRFPRRSLDFQLT
jgi:hypothetical protein